MIPSPSTVIKAHSGITRGILPRKYQSRGTPGSYKQQPQSAHESAGKTSWRVATLIRESQVHTPQCLSEEEQGVDEGNLAQP